LPLRWERRFGLVSEAGLGIARRALAFSMISWLPLVIWAWKTQRLFAGSAKEPLIQHFAIHVRCLVAIPLFIVAEATARSAGPLLNEYFAEGGLVPPADIPKLQAISE